MPVIFVKPLDEAQETVEAARRHARHLRHNYVGTEHLLLALSTGDFGIATRILNQWGVTSPRLKREVILELQTPQQEDDLTEADSQALASVGIDLPEVRRRIEETFGPSALDASPPCTTEPPLTPKARRALRGAAHQARNLGDSEVAPEHVLLAVLDDQSALAARLIERLGLTPHALRERLLRALRFN
ncbi:MAG: hypothetical protein M3198_15125 [Actinomycetota bacterium]|nr:hypothetical protein [Actinomycetota bacterium]